ncbi:kynurenine formamidase-like [Saccostrea echinata]|uniref:kynurenine formamidase-like n=1 Tax=Saccostrea echinata TaxID=191078 RepID=UPI002A83D06A|nr:kynurenine formamidase-like [Saccostrea echinata]
MTSTMEENQNFDSDLWRKWSREELDYQYSPSRWSKQGTPEQVINHHVKWTAEESKKVRDNIECELNISYGLTNGQKMDIFGANTLPGEAPIFVFIHGGYWQAMSKDDHSYVAHPLTKAGAVTILLEYTLAPKANIETIVAEVQQGMKFILNMAKRRQSRGVYLCGHSAGGQLAAMLLSVDWMSECMVSNSVIKGAILISGVFDLRPLVPSPINDPLKMTETSSWENSPMKVMGDIINRSKNRKIILAVAEDDPKEFHRQTHQAFQVLMATDITTDCVISPGVDHFGIVEKLLYEDFHLTQMAVEMMNLNIAEIDKQMQKTAV